MRTWVDELKAHTHNYVRRGGKQNRKKQVSLIINFMEFTTSVEKISSIHELGRRHVINFWKAHRDLPEKTTYDYWLGICKLWEWIGKNEKPPKPNNISPKNVEIPNETTSFEFLHQAITSAKKKRNISNEDLAKLSGCDLIMINEIECGKPDITLSAAYPLIKVLGIRFMDG